jgi:hypothetical protein
LARARYAANRIAESSTKGPAKKRFAAAVGKTASLALPSSLNWFKTVDPLLVGRVTGALRNGLELLAGDRAALHPLPGYVGLFDDVEPHRVTCRPEWRTSTTVAIARMMHDS